MTPVERRTAAAMGKALRGTASRLAALAALAAPVAAADRVSLELVLAVDVSLSVNDIEYALQMRGIAGAFRDPDVGALIAARQGGVAVTLTQWTGTFEAAQPLPWRVLYDADGAMAFADALAATPRQEFGNYTAIGHAIAFAAHLIETNGIESDAQTIDVSGDGRSNSGPEPRDARHLASGQGMTVNGLAIIDNDPALADYYTRNVIAGPGAFVIAARNFDDFGEAFRLKLKRELAPRLAALE